MTLTSTKVNRAIQILNVVKNLCWEINMEKECDKIISIRKSLIKEKARLEALK